MPFTSDILILLLTHIRRFKESALSTYFILGVKFGDLSRKVAAMWESMPESEKTVYRKRSEEDRARFNRETEVFKSSQSSATSSPQQQQPKTVKVVYLGSNNDGASPKSSPKKEEESSLFSSPGSQESLSNFQPQVWDVTGNKCLLDGCTQVSSLQRLSSNFYLLTYFSNCWGKELGKLFCDIRIQTKVPFK